jgi:hypothetical protein
MGAGVRNGSMDDPTDVERGNSIDKRDKQPQLLKYGK